MFPLAALVSLVSNQIDVRSQVRNLQYQRRFKADFANGIGNWLICLDNMTQGGIIIVCASIYFTSGIYTKIFTASSDV